MNINLGPIRRWFDRRIRLLKRCALALFVIPAVVVILLHSFNVVTGWPMVSRVLLQWAIIGLVVWGLLHVYELLHKKVIRARRVFRQIRASKEVAIGKLELIRNNLDTFTQREIKMICNRLLKIHTDYFLRHQNQFIDALDKDCTHKKASA